MREENLTNEDKMVGVAQWLAHSLVTGKVVGFEPTMAEIFSSSSTKLKINYCNSSRQK